MHQATAEPKATMTVRVFDKDGKLKHEETSTDVVVETPQPEEK